MQTALGGVGLFLRRMRFEPAAPLTTLALVAGTCFLFAALPRLFNSFADDGLRYTVSHAVPVSRNVRILDTGRIPGATGTDPLVSVAGSAGRSVQALPPALAELVDGSDVLVRSPRYILEADQRRLRVRKGLFHYLTLHVQQGAAPHLRVVSGRLPRPSTEQVSAPVARPTDLLGFGYAVPGLARTKRVPLVEIALSTATARELQMHVGQQFVFTPDVTDALVKYVPIREQQPLAVRIVGLFAVTDPNAPYWLDDSTLSLPSSRQAPDLDWKDVFGEALISPAQYRQALAATRPLQLSYEYRYFLDPDRLDAGSLSRLRADVAGIDARYAGAGPLDRRIVTGLGPVIDRYRSARSQAETLLAVAAIGLLACALASLALLGALSYERRRTETALSRTRGAAPRHLLGAQAAEALLIAAPAGFVGWAIATLTVPGRGSTLSAWFVLAIVAGTALLPVAAVVGLARRPLRPAEEREDAGVSRPSPRRLVLEGVIALAAGLGVYLVRRRGLAVSGGHGGIDAYLAAVPVLLGLACGIVALRLYPLPVAAAARLARRGRGLALHLGLSRTARHSDARSLLPLLVLVLALAIACFSAVLLSTMEAGQSRTGWRAVGSDLRVDAPSDGTLPPSLVTRLASLGTAAPAYVQQIDLTGAAQGPTLIALDLPDYERAVAGTPVAMHFPPGLKGPAPIPSVVPALVSTNWPTASSFSAEFPAGTLGFIPVEQVGSFPGVPLGTPFAVVSLKALEGAGAKLAPNRVYVTHANADAVRRAVKEAGGGAVVSTRAAVVRNLRGSPLIDGVLRGFRAAIGLAALYAAVAVGLMALIAARSRARDLALVRTMGGTQREGTLLAAVELTPFVATAVALGIGLGVAIPYLIAPGLSLTFYTRSAVNTITIPWLPPVAFAAGLLVLVASAVLVAGVRMRRARLDRVLRIGER